jgi:hypothetical protein
MYSDNEGSNPQNKGVVQMIFKSMTLEQAKAAVEEMKKDLTRNIQGKFMIRRNHQYKGWEQQGVWSFNVYFDLPLPKNKEAIKVAAYNAGMHCGDNYHVIGGTYGYVFYIHTP